jgi:hypothetical protein
MNGCRVCGISLTDNEYIALLDYVNRHTQEWPKMSYNQKAEQIKKQINPVSLM